MNAPPRDTPRLSALVASALGAGWVHGALLFGVVVSLLHVVHDRVVSAWNATVLLIASGVLYGIASALVFVGVAVALGLAGRVLKRPPSRPAAVFAGAFLFDLVFGFFVANWGLTYDEVPFGESPGGYIAWVVLRTLGVGLVAAVLAWLFAGTWTRLRASGRAGLAVAAAFGLFLLVHVGLAIAWSPPEDGAETAASLPDPESLRPSVPVALVAADGADWRVIRPLLEAGEMPNLAAMIEQGVHGDLASLPDANSAVLWASIYSGLTPRGHGVLDFYTVRLAGMTGGVFPVHRTGFKEMAGYLERVGLAERRTVDRSSLRAPLLWEVAAGMGRSVGVVDGYYYSYPAPALPGADDYFLAYGTDRFYQRVAPRGRNPRPPSTAREAADYARPPELLDELGEVLGGWEFDWQAAATLRLLDDRPRPDLLSFYAHQPDAVQHWRWRAYQPELYPGDEPPEVMANADEIPSFHRDLDRFLGELRERVGPETVIALVSDHGHSPTLLHAMDTQHRHGPPGIVVLAGGPVRRGAELEGADLYDVYPTVLHLLGLPVPEEGPDRSGRVLEEAFEPGWSAEAPVRTVAGYEALLPAFLPAEAGEGGEADERRRREELEKLKALGYVQ